jgi:hypothetical protein
MGSNPPVQAQYPEPNCSRKNKLPSRVVSIYGRSDAELSPRSLGSADRWFKSGLRNQNYSAPISSAYSPTIRIASPPYRNIVEAPTVGHSEECDSEYFPKAPK